MSAKYQSDGHSQSLPEILFTIKISSQEKFHFLDFVKMNMSYYMCLSVFSTHDFKLTKHRPKIVLFHRKNCLTVSILTTGVL